MVAVGCQTAAWARTGRRQINPGSYRRSGTVPSPSRSTPNRLVRRCTIGLPPNRVSKALPASNSLPVSRLQPATRRVVFEGQKLRFFNLPVDRRAGSGHTRRVLRVNAEGFDVRLNGGVLRCLRVQPEGSKKVGAGEWAQAAGLKEGFRFR
jgi:Formyl transferase, C-terminal domain